MVKVTPGCIKPGEDATVKVSGAPLANIAVVPVYSIGFGINGADPVRGDADAKGNFTGKWTVPKGAPAGEGKAKTAIAAKADVRQVEANFNVADATGDCSQSSASPKTAAANQAASSNTTANPGGITIPGASTTAPAGVGTTSTTADIVINGGAFKTTVVVTKPCVEPGEKQTVKVQTVDHGIVTYSVGYADYRGGGNSNSGSADSAGKYEDTFTVPAASSGDAILQAVVAAGGKRRSFAGTHFRVGNCN